MILASVILGAPGWAWGALIFAIVALGVLVWGYRRAPASLGVRVCAGVLKAIGIAALLLCLLEPLFSGRRPRPGANIFVLLTDDSQSLQISDPGAEKNRAETLRELSAEDAPWLARLSRDFDVRRYSFAERLQSLNSSEQLKAEGNGSALVTALQTIARRFQGRPLGGILLLTDGNATDLPDEAVDWSEFAYPVYPVPIGKEAPTKDVSIEQVAVSQTNFEQTPVTIRADISARGYDDARLLVRLLDSSGTQLQQQTLDPPEDDTPRVVRFRFNPARPGVSFYRLEAGALESPRRAEAEDPAEDADADSAEDADDDSAEATLANNSRLVVVRRPRGPYRVLYVSGQPNWEFKFLRRAVESDREVELVGLIRIAKREPKFVFLGRGTEETNPLYTGFEGEPSEETERYDQPVLIRLGTHDESELRDGFPQAADVLYQYHAVILDDVEKDFFTEDQMSLLESFVSRRGGGFLMLGGMESFREGGYHRTPIGDLLPVYLDPMTPLSSSALYQFTLAREGWLEPWVRLHETKLDEQQRLEAMPNFETLNRVQSIKPGAAVLANVLAAGPSLYPALVTQQFGKGRSAALLTGDLWRWSLGREAGEDDNLARAWRQMVRWLVADVPRRIELLAQPQPDSPAAAVQLQVRVRDGEFMPLDNASVKLVVYTPDKEEHRLSIEPSLDEAGTYQATYVPRRPGGYRARATVADADGSSIGYEETGWTAEPAAEEFHRLAPNLALLERIAAETGGQVVAADGLAGFVADLPNKKMPVTEPWTYPLWHQPLVFLLAIACLTAEWGLRRTKGLP